MGKLILSLLTVILLGCAPVLNLESGRTSGKGGQSVNANLLFYKVKDPNTYFPIAILPFAEVKYNYGVTNKLDVGLSATMGLNAQVFTKYQILGDQESKFAMSAGFKFGKQFKIGDYSPNRFYFPLYFSYHPTDKLSLFLNPMYALQVIKDGGNIHVLGATTGVLYNLKNGNEISFGVNYDNVMLKAKYPDSDETDNMFLLGVGYKFRF